MIMAMRGQPAAGGQPYASTMRAADQPGEAMRDTDAQVIDPDIQVLFARGAEAVRRDAVCDRPVRDARRTADGGDGRSMERGDGRIAVTERHAAYRHRFRFEEAVRRLGRR